MGRLSGQARVDNYFDEFCCKRQKSNSRLCAWISEHHSRLCFGWVKQWCVCLFGGWCLKSRQLLEFCSGLGRETESSSTAEDMAEVWSLCPHSLASCWWVSAHLWKFFHGFGVLSGMRNKVSSSDMGRMGEEVLKVCGMRKVWNKCLEDLICLLVHVQKIFF